jgi:hypothetical protein
MIYSLSKAIIDLHEKGFTHDFYLTEDTDSLRSALGGNTVYNSFSILVINQFYDRQSRRYIYMHAIETHCGVKGLLLSNKIVFNTHSLLNGKFDINACSTAIITI